VFFGTAVGGSDVFWIAQIKAKVDGPHFSRAWGLGYFLMLVGIVVGPIMLGRFLDAQ